MQIYTEKSIEENPFAAAGDTAILDIDSEEDFELMQVLCQYLFKNRPEFAEMYAAAGSVGK